MYMYICTSFSYTHMNIAVYDRVSLNIQWNLSNPYILGTEESVLISEVSLFQVHNTGCLGQPNVSCLSRCPYFRGVLNEGFHCTCIYRCTCSISILTSHSTAVGGTGGRCRRPIRPHSGHPLDHLCCM